MRYFWLGILLLKLVIISNNTWTQNPSPFFELTYGNSHNDLARYVEQTSDGGYIIAGYQTSPPDTTGNVWIIRTNHQGDTIWTCTYGSPNYDVAYCIKETSDSNFVACGVWNDPNDNDPNDFSGDIFVSLIDDSGNILWTWLYANGNNQLHGGANQIIEDYDGNFVLTGGMRSIGYTKKHAFLLKLNRSSQAVMWQKIFPPEDFVSYTTSVLPTPTDSGYIISGLIYPTYHAGCDIYLVKTDANGDTLWTNILCEWGDYEARHMSATLDGGYIITGNTAIPPTTTRLAYLLKVDSMGNYQWHNHFPSGYPNIPSSTWGVIQLADSTFALTGYFPFAQTNSQDLVLIKTDKNGNLIWMEGFGSEFYDKGYSINQTNEGFILGGYTKDNLGFSDVYFILANFNGIVTQVDNEELDIIAEHKILRIYPNPTSQLCRIDMNNTYEDITVDLYSCHGNQLWSKKYSSAQSITIDLNNFISGLYFILIRIDTELFMLKTIKQ